MIDKFDTDLVWLDKAPEGWEWVRNISATSGMFNLGIQMTDGSKTLWYDWTKIEDGGYFRMNRMMGKLLDGAKTYDETMRALSCIPAHNAPKEVVYG